MTDVREATTDEIPRLAETLASAFRDDPVFSFLTPERNREERMRGFFAAQLKFALDHGTIVMNDEGTGAAIWFPPEKWKIPTAHLLRLFPTMARTFGRRLPRVLGTISIIEKHHPKDPPHWYLEFLGTRRGIQRKGIGSSVISFMLDRCDREAIPAYLEASSSENVPFYRRHGFEVLEEIELKNGPTGWAMMRQPR